MYLNKLEVMGFCGSDPEVKQVGDKRVVKVSLAISQKRDDVVMWLDCDCWDKVGDIVEKYVKKGDPLYVEGRLQIRRVGDEGDRRTYVSCSVFNVQLLGMKSDGASGVGEVKKVVTPVVTEKDVDDVPF